MAVFSDNFIVLDEFTADETANAIRIDGDVAGFHDCTPGIIIKDGGVYGIAL